MIMSDFYCVRCDAEREEDCECGDLRICKPTPSDIIPAQLIQDLWGIGFTITKRTWLVHDLANGLAPLGMSYAWRDDPKNPNWKCVLASRHPGLFAPYGYRGDIEVNGLWLMERPKAEVDAFHAASHAKARQNVDDWFQRQAGVGFTGGVTVLSEGSQGRSADIREVGNKTLENATKIPRELTPHIGQIFEERDRLWSIADQWWGRQETEEYRQYRDLFAQHPDWTRGQLMNAVLTPIAIENIRTRLATEGAQHEQSTESSEGNPAGASSAPASGPASEGR